MFRKKKKLQPSPLLKQHQTVQWLKSRCGQKVQEKYLLNDSEVNQQKMMKKVFISLDRDCSNALDRDELYQMFIKYGFNIRKNDLKTFFKQIDENQDDNLNWAEFKNALKNKDALLTFCEIMKKIRSESEEKLQKQLDRKEQYYPMSFPNMVQYMNYCGLREDLQEEINDGKLSTIKRFRKCQELVNLISQCYDNKKSEIEKDSDDEEERVNTPKLAKPHINLAKKQEEQHLKEIRQVQYGYINNDQNRLKNIEIKTKKQLSRSENNNCQDYCSNIGILRKQINDDIEKVNVKYRSLISGLERQVIDLQIKKQNKQNRKFKVIDNPYQIPVCYNNYFKQNKKSTINTSYTSIERCTTSEERCGTAVPKSLLKRMNQQPKVIVTRSEVQTRESLCKPRIIKDTSHLNSNLRTSPSPTAIKRFQFDNNYLTQPDLKKEKHHQKKKLSRQKDLSLEEIQNRLL